MVGNVLEHGPDTQPEVRLFKNSTDSPLELFMEDNLAFDQEHQPLPPLNDKKLALAKEKAAVAGRAQGAARSRGQSACGQERRRPPLGPRRDR